MEPQPLAFKQESNNPYQMCPRPLTPPSAPLCEYRSTTNAFQITFDVSDPMHLAKFWAIALGYVVQPPPAGYETWDDFADEIAMPVETRGDLAAIIDPEEVRPRVLFQRVPEAKATKNRVHLDINIAEGRANNVSQAAAIEAHVELLIASGATKIKEFDDMSGRWTVMWDPEGNEFCVQ